MSDVDVEFRYRTDLWNSNLHPASCIRHPASGILHPAFRL